MKHGSWTGHRLHHWDAFVTESLIGGSGVHQFGSAVPRWTASPHNPRVTRLRGVGGGFVTRRLFFLRPIRSRLSGWGYRWAVMRGLVLSVRSRVERASRVTRPCLPPWKRCPPQTPMTLVSSSAYVRHSIRDSQDRHTAATEGGTYLAPAWGVQLFGWTVAWVAHAGLVNSGGLLVIRSGPLG